VTRILTALAAVGPDAAAARSAAALLERFHRVPVAAYSLAGYLRSPRAPSQIALCPTGRSAASDIAFLRKASARLLWPPPRELLAGAIEGLLGLEGPPPGARRAEAGGESGTSFFVEGKVTAARVRALAAAGATLLVAENPRTVRVSAALLKRLERLGLRFLALDPVRVAGILAPPALARSRSKWRSLVPRGARVWLRQSR